MAGTSQTAKALGTWSPELLDLSDAFTERATGIAITTFYETMAEPGGVMVRMSNPYHVLTLIP